MLFQYYACVSYHIQQLKYSDHLNVVSMHCVSDITETTNHVNTDLTNKTQLKLTKLQRAPMQRTSE